MHVVYDSSSSQNRQCARGALQRQSIVLLRMSSCLMNTNPSSPEHLSALKSRQEIPRAQWKSRGGLRLAPVYVCELLLERMNSSHRPSSCHRNATVAIAFFGLMRNARLYTIPSIRERILLPLAGSDVFVHSFFETEEKGTGLDVQADVDTFNACVARIDVAYPPEIRNLSLRVQRRTASLISAYRKRHLRLLPTSYTDKALANWLSSRYSIFALRGMLQKREVDRGSVYQSIVLARPDLVYRTRIPWRFPCQEGVVQIPNFHHCTGANDRFAHGSRFTMLKYMRQYESLISSTLSFNLSVRSTEAQLCRHLLRQDLQIQLFPACFSRTRADGSVARADAYQTPQLPHECILAGVRHLPSPTDFDCACKCEYVKSNCSPFLQLPIAKEVVRSVSPMLVQLVVYTTVLYDERVTPLSHRAWRGHVSGVQYVAFVSPFVAQTLPPEDYGVWRYVVLPFNSSSRMLSKRIKVSPSVFFPRVKYFMYLDFKLRLLVNPLTFVQSALKRSKSDTVFLRHPCTSASVSSYRPCESPPITPSRRRTAKEWIVSEVSRVIERKRTQSASRVLSAARQHSMHALNRSAYDYADTAIVVQRNSDVSRRFMCAWHSQMLLDCSDRDQISLFRVLQAFTERQVGFIEAVPPSCGTYCSWWERDTSRSVARITERVMKK